MMRLPTEREKQMDEIEMEISDYVVYDKYHDLSSSTIKTDAPNEIKDKFNLWKKLFNDQEKEDSIFR